MGADGRYGVGMRWLVLTPALSLSKRGDQSRAQGRSNAVQATLAPMFCPLLKGRGTGKPGFPVQPFRSRAQPSRTLTPGRGTGKPGFPGFNQVFSWEGTSPPTPLPGQGYGETWLPRASLFVGGRSPPTPLPGQGYGETLFPRASLFVGGHSPPAPSPRAGVWGNPGSPGSIKSFRGRASALPPLSPGRGMGKPGFPVQAFSWEDAALPPLSPGRGTGKPGFPGFNQVFSWKDAALPHPPLREG